MNLLYDHQIFSLQEFGGISRYFYELISFLEKDTFIDVSGYYSNNYYLEKTKYKKKSFFKNISFRGKRSFLNLINKRDSISKIKRNEYNVFHPTYYDTYFSDYINKKPFVITFHDMIHEKFSSLFPENDITKKWKKEIAQKASKIIAISENTKKDLLDIYNIEEEKIEVIYHGNSINLSNEVEININLPNNYLLFVGNRNGYKNFRLFIESVSSIINKEKINILCVGGGKFSKEEIALFVSKGIEHRIEQRNLNDNQLIEAYKNALAFIYPSLYEGFGMPILEAYACSCPLVCSETSCFPEIAKEGASYFNPLDIESIRYAIEAVLYNETYKKGLINKGKEIEKLFSWEKTCKQTLDLYKTL